MERMVQHPESQTPGARECTLSPFAYPPFVAHPLLRGGHAQTLAGVYLPSGVADSAAARHQVQLADGDTIVLHDDRPAVWQPGGRTVLLIHGLSGCHQSGYMLRIAHKLNARGVRVFRMDLRGCGAGFGLARLPYHSGQSADAAAALEFIGHECPGSLTTLVGFSLGANITLKLLGEMPDELPSNLDSAAAVSPPIDLAVSVANLNRWSNRLYDRHFVRALMTQMRAHRARGFDSAAARYSQRPRKIYDLDNTFTAPVSGFGTAANYYQQCSSGRFLADIRLPTLIIASSDDPLVPHQPLVAAVLSKSTTLALTHGGGHLGFIASRGIDADRRWMDWRIIDWVERFRSG